MRRAAFERAAPFLEEVECVFLIKEIVMPKSVQEHLVAAIEQSAGEIIAVLKEVPDDKLDWRPLAKGRSALDQMQECAVLNGYTTTILQENKWEMESFGNYEQDRRAIGAGREALCKALRESIPPLCAAIRALPDEKLDVEISTPFGPMSWEKIATYPYWNMSYHTGQITYIATLLGSE